MIVSAVVLAEIKINVEFRISMPKYLYIFFVGGNILNTKNCAIVSKEKDVGKEFIAIIIINIIVKRKKS